ncbi:uncharacterized protein [Coffea arabica]|uniref:CCHC-type domain-containing protein n=1 Tax=Coffea arabica TaxID=13443 RepID=A0A6P6V8B9_COFAR|nr:uncharacterized protein LOC113718240 [Coffea arabica]
MAKELVEIMQNFTLSSKGRGSTYLDLGDVDDGIMDCQDSLIGKIKGEKIANFTGVKKFVTVAWSYPKGLEVIELWPNLFQFTIPDAQDKERIWLRGPRVTDNQILVLREWEIGIEENDSAFNLAPLCVQFWNLPLHWLTKSVEKKIGAIFDEVKDVIIQQTGGKEGKHMKILVQADISQPLLRGTTVQMNGVNKWLSFRYEKCSDFCYSCGIIGHSERNCKEPAVVKSGQHQNQYGPWLRAVSSKGSPQKENNPKI